MNSTNTHEFSLACRGMLAKFFDRFPDEAFQSVACQSLEAFLTQRHHREGKPGGWTGGLVYALAKDIGPGKHVVLNSDLEAIFGTTMGTIRRRAEQVWPVIEADVTRLLSGQHEFTLRDEANAICAYAFRNGPIEDIHASVDSDRRPRITDPEMKEVMIDASSKLAKLLEMKAADPRGYRDFLKDYHHIYCWKWER
jgi:hypothetical protein